jgi:hypothetical protein
MKPPGRLAVLLATILTSLTGVGGSDATAQSDVETLLKAQTQALLDAVGTGDAKVWDRYLDPDMSYVSEAGEQKTKADLLQEVAPLPAGISGKITIASFAAHVFGDTAIAVHDDHETEDYFGQPLTAEYRTTDTWIRRRDGWKLAASQVQARLADPPAIHLPAAKLDEYVGTYRLTADIVFSIRRNGETLIGERPGREPQTLNIEAADVMFVSGQPRTRKIFQRTADGQIRAFVDRREGRDLTWTRVP